jgi:beta-lactamase class D
MVTAMRIFPLAFCLCISFTACAEDATIAQLFRKAGIEGTIVIESLSTGRRFVHDDSRSQQPYTVASTFKIFNTLIALEEGAISGADAKFDWNGTKYEIADWNHDQTLESAFRVSCVWCYQQLAERVGSEKYREYIQQTQYGQLREPFNVTEFWLDGSLTSSADQQVAFLRQVTKRSLRLKASSYDTLKRIMLTEETRQYRLYGKTGWATRTNPQVGWFVGYVETLVDTWLFALNLDTQNDKDLPLRIQITKEALRTIGVLPSS